MSRGNYGQAAFCGRLYGAINARFQDWITPSVRLRFHGRPHPHTTYYQQQVRWYVEVGLGPLYVRLGWTYPKSSYDYKRFEDRFGGAR